MPNDVTPWIASPEHAGRVLRSMSLGSIGLILRGLIAALPAGFWTTLAAIAIRLMPYLSTPALEGSAGVASQSQLESAIRRTAD